MPDLNNQKDVAGYLAGKGYKVSHATVNRHVKAGKLKKGEGGVFRERDVLRYARDFLQTKDTYLTVRDEELSRQKLKAETDRTTYQAQREKYKLEVDQGKYILKDQVFLEMAARAAVLEAGYKGMIQQRAGEWIDLVNGDGDLAPDLIRELLAEFDKFLNDFAQPREWQVLFEPDEELIAS